jgi:HemY protein
MIKALILFVKIAIVVAIFVWFRNHPGAVDMQWFGYQMEIKNVGFLLALVLLITVIAVMAYLIWRFILNVPGGFGAARRERRRRKGYQALTQGMVAVAAGEGELASRLSRKADALLEEPPLTMLLSAQAAQLNGDDGAARRYFEAMLENEETRFLGLRGLLIQAQRAGDDVAALDYTRQAQAVKPKSEWVLNSLVELSERCGDLAGAEDALRQAAKHKAMPEAEAIRKRAVVQVMRAIEAQAADQLQNALILAREAHGLAPDLVPATLVLSRTAVAANRRREALKVLEKSWPVAPHPDLARAYLELWPGDSDVERVSRLEKFVASRADHIESRLIVAEIALDARLWGEARSKLNQAIEAASAKGTPTARAGQAAARSSDLPGRRLCRLMARLEQEEHGDGDAARQWLQRASVAAPDTAWVCNSCGAVAARWDAHCGACKSFDSLRWQNPPRVAPALTTLQDEDADLVDDASGAVLLPPVRTSEASGGVSRRSAVPEVSESGKSPGAGRGDAPGTYRPAAPVEGSSAPLVPDQEATVRRGLET